MGIIDRIKKTTKTDETAEAKPVKKAAVKKAAPAKKVAKTETAPVVVPADASAAPIVTKSTNTVLVRPVVTEKAATAQTSANKYTFIVARWAKKAAVKAAVKEVYGVEPVAVNMINVEGHRMRFAKNTGKRSDFKKAIVTLPAGKTITIHQGV